jgi:hypothetical protein
MIKYLISCSFYVKFIFSEPFKWSTVQQVHFKSKPEIMSELNEHGIISKTDNSESGSNKRHTKSSFYGEESGENQMPNTGRNRNVNEEDDLMKRGDFKYFYSGRKLL